MINEMRDEIWIFLRIYDDKKQRDILELKKKKNERLLIMASSSNIA